MNAENAAATMIRDAGWEKLLPWVALFVRLAIGLAMLDVGLASVMSGPGPGPGAWTTPLPPANILIRSVGPNGMALPGWTPPAPTPPPGFEMVFQVLPYAALALGVGLVFGIFTTVSALLACGMVVVIPVVLTVQTIIRGGIGAGARPFGPNSVLAILGDQPPSLTLAMMVATVPAMAALVLLSPVSINRYAVDSLIFGRPTIAPLPPAEAPGPGGPA